MKSLLLVLSVLWCFQIAHAGGDEGDCSKYLSINNYFPKRDRHAGKSYAFSIELASYRASITIIPTPGQWTIVQFINSGTSHTEMDNLLRANLVRLVSPKFATSNQVFVPEGGERIDLILEALREIQQNIFGAYKKPEILAMPLSKNGRGKVASERIEGLRNHLTKFLRENGMAREDQRFFDLYLSIVHRNAINQLSSAELSYFDYSVFDQQLSYGAYTRAEELDRAWLNLDPNRPTYDKVHEGIRKRFLTIAHRELLRYSHQKGRSQEILKSMTLEIAQIVKEGGFGYVKQVPKEILELSGRELEPNDISALVKLYNRHPYQFRTFRVESVSNLLPFDDHYLANNDYWSAEVDHKPTVIVPKVYIGEVTQVKSSSLETGLPSTDFGGSMAGPLMRSMDRSAAERGAMEESAADSGASIDEEIHDPEIISLLQSVGINQIYEITNYSAADYVDQFKFSTVQFEKLLDELNALGIHLHFDADWDRREGNRFRKRRPEFYEFRHVPHRVVKWPQGSTPSEDQRRDSRQNQGPTQNP